MISMRKIKILELVIESYIETAEPVGSRTISKKSDLGISPATIRNEMSDLEELGYITQPHTSAGRIPSDKGYRLYVDNIVKQKQLTEAEIEIIRRMIISNIEEVDYVLEKTAEAISMLTNYTTIMTEPKANEIKIKMVKLIEVDSSTLILVVVMEDNKAKNFTIKTTVPKDLQNFNLVMNKHISEKAVCEIDAKLMDNILEEIERKDIDVAEKVFEAIYSIDNTRIYTSGMRNILAFPEFHDLQKAKEIFGFFEQHGLLSSLFNNNSDDNIDITIGSENCIDMLKNCSLVRTNFSLGKNSSTKIGILGPTRMDYSQVISVLNAVENLISRPETS